MQTPCLPSIVLGLLLSSPVHAMLPQEAEDEAPEVTTAAADAVQGLLADYEDALASKDGRKVMRVLDRMAAHDNADFLEAATKSLKYKATKVDKKLVAETAKELGIQSRPQIAKMAARSEADVQASAARLLGNIPGKDSTNALMKVFKDKKISSDKPLVLAAVIDALGRLGHAKAEPQVKDEFRRFREENVHRACVIYFGRIKTRDHDVVRSLCEQLESPEPGNVDSASNPPASYWEARWRVWQVTRRDVSWALMEITGQRFKPAEGGLEGDGEKALRWLEENGKQLGIK